MRRIWIVERTRTKPVSSSRSQRSHPKRRALVLIGGRTDIPVSSTSREGSNHCGLPVHPPTFCAWQLLPLPVVPGRFVSTPYLSPALSLVLGLWDVPYAAGRLCEPNSGVTCFKRQHRDAGGDLSRKNDE